MNDALLSSDRLTWNTPHEVLAPVRRFGGGDIALDPCSNGDSVVAALVEWRGAHGTDSILCDACGMGVRSAWCKDGRIESWARAAAGGVVYMNPPFGKHIAEWTDKAATEGDAGAIVIGLVPARTDTRWFQDDIFARATAICWWRGRVRFIGAPASAPFPVAVVLWGSPVQYVAFADAFGDYGRVVLL